MTAANIPIPSYLISLSLIPAMVCSLFCTFGDSTLPVVYAGVAPSLRTYKSLKHSSGKARIWPGFTYLRTYKSLKLQLFSDIVFHCFTYLRTYKSLKHISGAGIKVHSFTYLRTYKSLKPRTQRWKQSCCFTYLRTYKSLKLIWMRNTR